MLNYLYPWLYMAVSVFYDKSWLKHQEIYKLCQHRIFDLLSYYCLSFLANIMFFGYGTSVFMLVD